MAEKAIKGGLTQKASRKAVAARVTVKLEGSVALTPQQAGSANRKRRLAAHRAMTAGRAVVPVQDKKPKGMLALMERSWDEKEQCPVLLHVGWSRKRKNEMPKMPDDPTE